MWLCPCCCINGYTIGYEDNQSCQIAFSAGTDLHGVRAVCWCFHQLQLNNLHSGRRVANSCFPKYALDHVGIHTMSTSCTFTSSSFRFTTQPNLCFRKQYLQTVSPVTTFHPPRSQTTSRTAQNMYTARSALFSRLNISRILPSHNRCTKTRCPASTTTWSRKACRKK
jgi:hypothetical protein